MAYKRIVIWDLDATIVDSSHRTPNHPDGTLNLPLYLKMKNRESTMKDTLLPLAAVWKNLCKDENYIVVCTARTWADFDQEFLDVNGLHADKIIARFTERHNHMRDPELKRKGLSYLFYLKQFKNLPKFMFDDAKPVISEMRKMGMVCMNAISVNKRLAA